jgi:hypothetical protein
MQFGVPSFSYPHFANKAGRAVSVCGDESWALESSIAPNGVDAPPHSGDGGQLEFPMFVEAVRQFRSGAPEEDGVRGEGMCLHPAVHNRRLMAGLRPGVFDGYIGGPVAGATHDEVRLLQAPRDVRARTPRTTSCNPPRSRSSADRPGWCQPAPAPFRGPRREPPIRAGGCSPIRDFPDRRGGCARRRPVQAGGPRRTRRRRPWPLTLLLSALGQARQRRIQAAGSQTLDQEALKEGPDRLFRASDAVAHGAPFQRLSRSIERAMDSQGRVLFAARGSRAGEDAHQCEVAIVPHFRLRGSLPRLGARRRCPPSSNLALLGQRKLVLELCGLHRGRGIALTEEGGRSEEAIAVQRPLARRRPRRPMRARRPGPCHRAFVERAPCRGCWW